MADFWDFLGGAANTQLSTLNARDADARETNKLRAVEALRRETSDYEYARGKKKVDPNQSYFDDTANEFVMVNSEGEVIGRRAGTQAEKDARTAGKLDLDYKRAQIDNIGVDNSLRSRQLDIQEAGIADSRAARAEARSERRSLDSAGAGPKAKLYATAALALKDLKEVGVPDNMQARARATLNRRIEAGTASDRWIRNYTAEMLNTPQVKKELDSRQSLRVQQDIFGD